tara:strand:+ start:155 stop:367 length:213 start_codon:yes stop_codon:yes gene_type:complete
MTNLNDHIPVDNFYAKPWDATPGKMIRGKHPKTIEEEKKRKDNFEKNWEKIFGSKPLNNIQGSKESEEDD